MVEFERERGGEPGAGVSATSTAIAAEAGRKMSTPLSKIIESRTHCINSSREICPSWFSSAYCRHTHTHTESGHPQQILASGNSKTQTLRIGPVQEKRRTSRAFSVANAARVSAVSRDLCSVFSVRRSMNLFVDKSMLYSSSLRNTGE